MNIDILLKSEKVKGVKKLKYLVVGTGRCGTVYMARMFTTWGVPCGHESIFDWQGLEKAKQRLNGEVDVRLSHTSVTEHDTVANVSHSIEPWLKNPKEIEADSSYMAAPFLREDILAHTKVIHLVRNPIRVVNSFCNYLYYFKHTQPLNAYEKNIYSHIPELTDSHSVYDRGCLYYVKWNQIIEDSNPDFFHRAEDDPKALMDFLGATGEPFPDTKVNTYKRPKSENFHIDCISDSKIKEEFIEMGRRYGYDMISKHLLL